MSGPGVKEFLLPDLGEGLEDASVVCWNVAVGDVIELNQTLCSLETAKAEVEIPSPYAGRIVELCGAEGDVLEVGSVLVRIDTNATERDPGPPPQGSAASHSGNGNGVAGDGNGSKAGGASVLVGYGTDSGIDSSRREKRGPGGRSRPRAAPPVRKLAAELLVDLEKLEPGRVPADSLPVRT